MEIFDVLYDQNRGGTFGGCLDTLHLSLGRFIKDKVIEDIPNIVLDCRPYPTTGKLFNYLRGGEEKFFVEENGRPVARFFQKPESIFLRLAEYREKDIL